MSDSDESGVTYTDVSSPFEELLDIGSPGADDHEHLELPEILKDPYVEVALQAPPSPDYIPGPEDPEQAPPSPDYVPGPEHADDEIVAEDQPYAEDASPTAQSPEYVLESDLEAHLEDNDDEDPEEDPVDYPADGGDDGDDEEGSSEDDEDDDMDIEADEEEEEEEHPAPVDSIVVALTAADQAPSAEETEPFESDESAATPPPHPAYRMTARISIPAPVPVPAWSDSEIPFPPLPPILSPPSPVLSPSPPPSPICYLGYRAAMIRLQAEAASTSHSPQLPPPFILSPTRSDAPSSGTPLLLHISAPTSSPPLQLPSASRREDRPEVTLPPQKRLGIALGPGYEVGESSSAAAAARPAGGLRADYGFVATMNREIRRDPEREAGYGIIDSVRRDTDEIYMRLDDEQSERQLLAGRLNMLFRDRRAHAYTCHLMETEARLSREAWVRSTDASNLVREMLRADHRRSIEIIGLRTALQGQVTALQGQVIALRTQVTALQGQQELTGGPTQPELPEEAETNGTKTNYQVNSRQETINTTLVINAQLQAMIDQGVTAALAARDALKSTNGDDSHSSGTGVRRTEQATHKCTYTDFLKCQPLHFKGTKGVASLSQWFERMKSVFHISNCAVENQVKFATCTLHYVALKWWNTHVKTVGHDAAYGMPWKTLMKMMTGKYCP
nr:hypothetical protein [Tanacetum cinerariifolium]